MQKLEKLFLTGIHRSALAPASTQKIITSAIAYELLGKDFRYTTYIGYDIGIDDQELLGNLYIEGSGDPSLGSSDGKAQRSPLSSIKYQML